MARAAGSWGCHSLSQEARGNSGFEDDQETGLCMSNLHSLSDIQVEMSNQIYGLKFRGENWIA